MSDKEIIKPFKSYCPTSYPEYYPCEEIVYITKTDFEFPLLRNNQEFKIGDKFIEYRIESDKIKLLKDSVNYEYEFSYTDGKICFDFERLCFEKINQSQSKIDSTIFKFNVVDDYSIPYTIWVNFNYSKERKLCKILYDGTNEELEVKLTTSEIDYIINLLERIPENDLNRIYNNGLSDCREISIDFYTEKGKWKGIETCGVSNENTFEIRALITNMFWIMSNYLEKK